MRSSTCASMDTAPWRVHGAVALVVTAALLGGSACLTGGRRPAAVAAAIVSGAAAGLTGGVSELVLFTLTQILQMRRDLTEAEELAAMRRVESEQATARARTSLRSADARRLSAEAENAAAASAEAVEAVADVQGELAETLGLTGVPDSELAAAIHARLAELEAELAAQEQR